MPKDGMPFIQYISSDIKIINAKNDNVFFEFVIPEIRGGDFDQRNKASKKAIKNLIKHIKTTNFLENQDYEKFIKFWNYCFIPNL